MKSYALAGASKRAVEMYATPILGQFARTARLVGVFDSNPGRAAYLSRECDRKHGADYFRRWHRRKENSGGLLVSKATHHFDMINWWLEDDPERVEALGRLQFYGPTRLEHGTAGGRDRAPGAGGEQHDHRVHHGRWPGDP